MTDTERKTIEDIAALKTSVSAILSAVEKSSKKIEDLGTTLNEYNNFVVQLRSGQEIIEKNIVSLKMTEKKQDEKISDIFRYRDEMTFTLRAYKNILTFFGVTTFSGIVGTIALIIKFINA